jgi:hypothetical protein
MRFNVEEWIKMVEKRKRSNQGSNQHSSVEYAPEVVLVTPKHYKRIENIRAAFRPELKQKVTLPKFSWDKTNDE